MLGIDSLRYLQLKRSSEFEAMLLSIIQRYEKATGVAVYCLVLTVEKTDREG